MQTLDLTVSILGFFGSPSSIFPTPAYTRMRYEDWDVLLFPSGGDARVPLKEFKVGCHVVPDSEFSHNRGTFGLPVTTCFVPGLQPGAPFHISIHCWANPKVSQYTQSYSKHPELVKLEARILVDGRLVA